MAIKLYTAFALLLLSADLSVSDDLCRGTATIGNNNETKLNRDDKKSFYLDVNHPTRCAGTITRLRVCYYRPPEEKNGIHHAGGTDYWATYAVYRRVAGAYYYRRVSESFNNITGRFMWL